MSGGSEMDSELTLPRLSVGFLEDRSVAQPHEFMVPVNELVGVLASFQNAVYASAAFDLNLMSVRRLTKSQRKQYALAVVSFRHGSLLTELLPAAVAMYISYQQTGVLFPPEVLKAMGTDAMMRVWNAVNRAVDVMGKQLRGEDSDPRVDRVIGRNTAKIAKAAIKHGQTIEIQLKEPTGAEFSFRTTAETAKAFLQHRKKDPEVEGTFSGLIVKDIMTTVPVFNVRDPQHPDIKIRCEYPKGQEVSYARHLVIGQEVTITGTGVWTDPDNLSDTPDKIVVLRVSTSNGVTIGQGRLDQPA